MKSKHFRNLLGAPLLAAALASGTATAGVEEMTMAPAPIAAPADDIISGTLSLDFNSHFVSYGFDVWGDGSSMSEPTFNPSLELSFALPADLTLTLGTWWDVNSKGGGNSSPLGGRIQEIDVWTGLSYTWDKLTMGVTYQAWMYGSDTEDILDVSFAYDTFLSPSLTIHNRLDEGASGGTTGTILVLGLEHGFELGPVSLAIPLNVAYFLDDDFHPASTDDGFGYVSIGLAASVPLAFTEPLGGWTLNGGLTYYMTDDDVVANARQDDFLTASIGVSVDF